MSKKLGGGKESQAKAQKKPAPLTTVLAQDAVMARLVERHPALNPQPQALFPALANSVVSQQLSSKAARTIWNRLEAMFAVEAAVLAQAPHEALRAVGLSNSKAGYVKGLAEFALAGGLENLDHLTDDELIAQLTRLKGIGVWTVQMVLIFTLGRSDVWPTGDLGIQKAAAHLYGVSTKQGLSELGERFRPYRSHAAWYLWRSLED